MVDATKSLPPLPRQDDGAVHRRWVAVHQWAVVLASLCPAREVVQVDLEVVLEVVLVAVLAEAQEGGRVVQAVVQEGVVHRVARVVAVVAARNSSLWMFLPTRPTTQRFLKERWSLSAPALRRTWVPS